MAQPQTSFIKQAPTAPKRFNAFAIVQSGGLWVCRTMTIEGDRIVKQEDSTPDTRAGAAGIALRGIARDRS